MEWHKMRHIHRFERSGVKTETVENALEAGVLLGGLQRCFHLFISHRHHLYRAGANPRKLTQKNYVDPRPGGRACTPNANLLLLNYYAHAAQVLDPCIRSFRITFSL